MSRRGKKRNWSRERSNNEIMQVVEHSPVTISFSPEDAHGVQMPHNDALVIKSSFTTSGSARSWWMTGVK